MMGLFWNFLTLLDTHKSFDFLTSGVKLVCIVLILTLINTYGRAQNIIVDGDLSDWRSQPILDQQDPVPASSDIRRTNLSDDESHLYITMTLGGELDLQDGDAVRIYLDLDDDASTGEPYRGYGVDLFYNFSGRFGYVVRGGVRSFIGHADIELVTAPTVTASTFECSVRKSLLPPIADRVCLLVQTDQDHAPDQGFDCYTLGRAQRSYAGWSPTRASTDVRVLSYNVLNDRLFDNEAEGAYRRILNMLDADIICFQEIYEHSASDIERRMADLTGTNQSAYVAYVTPDIAIYSKYPILESERIRGTGNAIFAVDVDGTTWYIVNVHLPCCDRNLERQQEIDAIHAYLRDARRGLENMQIQNESPILIIGDMNTVGSVQDITSLRDGDIVDEARYGPDYQPDWDGTALEDASPITTGTPYVATWYASSSSYNPGRLDLCLYTDAVLDLSQQFTLHTRFIEEDLLLALGLRPTDTELASDHMPLVLDFNKYLLSSSYSINNNNKHSISIYPHPANQYLQLHSAAERRIDSLKIYDLQGRLRLEHGALLSSEKLPIQHLEPATYLLELSTNNSTQYLRFVKI